MGRKFDFDVIVIGAGPAGIAAAKGLGRKKKLVAVIDENEPGGANVNTRDVPYSVALSFSHLYDQARRESLGINLRANLPTIVAKERAATRKLNEKAKKELEDIGIVIIKGFGYIVNKNTVIVGEKQYSADRIIIATGAELDPGAIQGLSTVNYFSPNSAMQIWRVPESLVVVGGGAAGIEIAEYFAELGANVMIIEKTMRILPNEEKEVSELIRNYLEKRLGVTILTGTRVTALEQDSLGKATIFQSPGGEKMVRSEVIVLATGSKPAISDMGLENAGVKMKKAGIEVEQDFQTSEKHIFAIGDAIGTANSSTDRAAYQGKLLALAMTERTKPAINYAGFVRTIKTAPEIAVVGSTEEELKKLRRKYKATLVPFSETAKGQITGEIGFVKLIAGVKNQILGATIVGTNATTMIQEIVLAMRYGQGPLEIGGAPHPMNEYSEAIQIAARRLIKR